MIFFFYFSVKSYVVTLHSSPLATMVLMMGHNIHFHGEIWKTIPKLSKFLYEALKTYANEKQNSQYIKSYDKASGTLQMAIFKYKVHVYCSHFI